MDELSTLSRPPGQIATRVIGRVPRALLLGDLVDQDSLATPQLGRAMVPGADLGMTAQALRAALLLLGAYAVAEGGRRGSRPRRVREGVHSGDPGRVDRPERTLGCVRRRR